MKREDFKEIKEEHFKTCKKLIENDGICIDIECNSCPFFYENSTNDQDCVDNGYTNDSNDVKDEFCIKSAKEFLNLKETSSLKYDIKWLESRLEVAERNLSKLEKYLGTETYEKILKEE